MTKQFQAKENQCVYISGYKQKQLTCNILNHILNYTGSKIGLATLAGMYLDGLDMKQPKYPFFKAVDFFKNNYQINTSLYEVRPRHLYKYHQDYKKCTVAAITNIDTKNMLSGSLNSKERIFQAFSLLENLSENKPVINADDKVCQEFIKLKHHSRFVLVSLIENNPIIQTHTEQGGSGAYVEQQQLIVYHNKQRHILCSLKDLPPSCQGKSGQRVLCYTLLAVCCAYLMGKDLQVIAQSLRTIKTSAPVQLKIINDLDSKVIVFNHRNSASINYIPLFLRKLHLKKQCTLVCSINLYQQLKKNNHKLIKYINKCVFSDQQAGSNLLQYNEFQALKKAFESSGKKEQLVLLATENYGQMTEQLFKGDFNKTLEQHPFITIEQKSNSNLSILFLGDTGFGENYQEKVAARGGKNILTSEGYEYPLLKMKECLLNADMVFANLETPLTTIDVSPMAGKKSWVHWGDVFKTTKSFLQHNIRFVTLANNHSFDYGMEGFIETLDTLEQSGIHYTGAGRTHEDAIRPILINAETSLRSEKIAIIGAYSWSKSNHDKFQLYADKEHGGLNALIVEKLKDQINTIRSVEENIYIILSLHWGKNYQWVSDSQKQLARKLLSSGADLIIGHGAHMIQEFEKIDDKWVIYSIGNFMFNSPGRYKKLKAPPYSFVAELGLTEPTIKQGRNFKKQLRLYPIVTDNRITAYQSRFVNEEEFSTLSDILNKRNNQPLVVDDCMQNGKKRFCYLIDL